MSKAILAMVLTIIYGIGICQAATGMADDTPQQRPKSSAKSSGVDQAGQKIQRHPVATVPLPKSPGPRVSNQRQSPPRPGASRVPAKTRIARTSSAHNNAHESNLSRTLRPSVMPRTSVSETSSLRHRSPNAAIIGGPNRSRVANANVLNGSQMHRKP
jgi:hypothetical protein